MSLKYFEDDCPGCRPALLDMETKKPMPEDSPQMQAVLAVWDTTTPEERQAFHRFTCQNSRTPEDLKVINNLSARISAALSGSTD
jgi:hypothetical protein